MMPCIIPNHIKLILLTCALFLSTLSGAAQNGVYLPMPPQHKALVGHVPVQATSAHQLSAVEDDRVLNFTVALSHNHSADLDQFLIDVQNPTSPTYHHYLAPQDFLKRFAPTQDQVDQVRAYLLTNGITINSVSANRLLIRASGQAQKVSTAFNTRLHYYTGLHGGKYYAPSYELTVPKDLSIQGVHGLDNFYHARHHAIWKPNLNSNSSAVPQGLTPTQLRNAYGISDALASKINGAGQTLALFELDGYTPSDIQIYEQSFALPKIPLQNILVGAATGAAGDGAIEVTLDIQLMAAVAPGVSKILVYEGENTSDGVLNTYNQIATDNLAQSISTSWGMSENNSDLASLQTEDSIFKQMAAQGQSIFAASGDSGAYDDGTNLGVDDPASQPFVVGVGGTSLNLNTDTDGSYQSETTWNGGSAESGAGGGGVSAVWSIPSWQVGVISPSSLGSKTMRNVPDVSMDADPNTGYAVYFGGQWGVVGGTSCGAPVWAAFTALVNQGHTPLGFPNPALYAIGKSSVYSASFHDVNDGSTNLYFPAVANYDNATGWGSIQGGQLLATLASGTPPTPNPSGAPGACIRAIPGVVISPNIQSGPAGGWVSYSVTVANYDTKGCSTEPLSFHITVPPGFSYTETDLGDGNDLTIDPGYQVQLNLSVHTADTTIAGNYPIGVSASHSGSLNGISRASAVYAVTVPSQYALSVQTSFADQKYTYDSNQEIHFQTHVLRAGKSASYIPVKIDVKGPVTFTAAGKADADGYFDEKILLKSAVPRGRYVLTATASANGVTEQSSVQFNVE